MLVAIETVKYIRHSRSSNILCHSSTNTVSVTGWIIVLKTGWNSS